MSTVPSKLSRTIPASATAGEETTRLAPEWLDRLRDLSRSFATKLALLLVIFMAVPVVLYGQFRVADEERNALLHRSVQEEGRLLAESLKPMLESFGGRTVGKLGEALHRLSGDHVNVKILFRPTGIVGSDQFFYIAANPPVPNDYLEKEREQLVRAGILVKLADTCGGDRPVAMRYINPAGVEELLTAVVPVNLPAGCWVVITSQATQAFLRSSIGRPYWQMPEVRIAAAIYVLLAVAVLSLFLDVWRSLRKFQGLAHEIRVENAPHRSFRALNRIPELDRVAEEFDRMVASLAESAENMRQTAEENAHAFKAPLGVIAQSIEPLRKTVGASDARGRRAVELIERSVARLDALVTAARQMDRATAELLDPPRQVVDLSALVSGMMAGYRDAARERGIRIEADVARGLRAVGGEDLFEAVVENLVENALSFSPPAGTVSISLRASGRAVTLTVDDEGPGVPEDLIDLIFERYVSHRPAPILEDNGSRSENHFGIGLWIVRRNVMAVKGAVSAHNRAAGGFSIVVTLPRAG